MLTVSSKHPDAEAFIDAKMEQGKVTGANVSVRIDDDFMRAAENGAPYRQQFPVNSDNPNVVQDVDAAAIWKKIIHNAWKSAEPGVLFWDTIIRESVPDCYSDLGFETISTNPCGEIPLCPYDSCRLTAINLYSYVENPFTPDAKFNFDLLRKHVGKAQRIMDDIIDLEMEKIELIISKIKEDPETAEVKSTELHLWEKIRDKTLKGRRTGCGTTGEGDMIAAMGLRYGTPEATEFSVEVHKQLALAYYDASVTAAEERGAFEIYDAEREKQSIHPAHQGGRSGALRKNGETRQTQHRLPHDRAYRYHFAHDPDHIGHRTRVPPRLQEKAEDSARRRERDSRLCRRSRRSV